MINEEALSDTIKMFWHLKEIPAETTPDPNTILCETHYSQTVHKNKCGRYTVALPFITATRKFPHARDIALRRFHLLEQRFIRNPSMQKDYVVFMDGYSL